jgi:hypothetical protein
VATGEVVSVMTVRSLHTWRLALYKLPYDRRPVRVEQARNESAADEECVL